MEYTAMHNAVPARKYKFTNLKSVGNSRLKPTGVIGHSELSCAPGHPMGNYIVGEAKESLDRIERASNCKRTRNRGEIVYYIYLGKATISYRK
jgi:hypothetical protein